MEAKRGIRSFATLRPRQLETLSIAFQGRAAATSGGLVVISFEDGSCFFEVEDLSIHGQLILSGVFGHGGDSFDAMAMLSKGFD
jgi:hypothetical protein